MTNKDLTPAQFAKLIGHGRGFVMALIAAGEIVARDERAPGSTRPRYLIAPSEASAWRERRKVLSGTPEDRRLNSMPRLDGVMDYQFMKIEKCRNRAGAIK